MLVLITYDVNTIAATGRKRLSRIAKVCTNYGQRVQNSVFECDVDPAQLVLIRAQLLEIMDKKEDSIRIYHLGTRSKCTIEEYGAKTSYNPEGFLSL